MCTKLQRWSCVPMKSNDLVLQITFDIPFIHVHSLIYISSVFNRLRLIIYDIPAGDLTSKAEN